jgi:hypothetical protein
MKRLIKKAETNLVDFVNDWFYSWENIPSLTIDDIINKNQDSTFAGTCFRFISMNLETIMYKELDVEKLDDPISITLIKNTIKKHIQQNDKYTSWTKNYHTCEKIQSDMIADDDRYSVGVIIVSNVNGIDLCELCNKHADELVDKVENNSIDAVLSEEEVIAKFPKNYDIVTLIADGNKIMLNNDTISMKEIDQLFNY